MPVGKVKWFSVSKGYGFITPDDGAPDLFLHLTKVQEANLPTLEAGTSLKYPIGSRNGKSFAEGLSLAPKPVAKQQRPNAGGVGSDLETEFEKEWGLRRR
ncbi:cold shock domain-containing protein [Aliirhizobium smilacinae]|uniref:Cold shock domain-containing protein n=1 Tax=Aliirhizobium smilacinae TaxID=1395944 RepID=A0A5C4XNG1_9HYPH|nr:cold shock domain-containing protein [Rhizobium smilacinae]TNM64962.1 cold shock domain-containing protein [Rhizobium smilacinae]